ncbi:hypothetical protein QQ045_029379 [Rhodiola kirilowii]
MLGRRDGLTANRSGADMNLPGPTNPVDDIKKKFSNALIHLGGQDAQISQIGCTTSAAPATQTQP